VIAVTGGAGFIGSAIIRSLNLRGITDILVVEEHELSSEKKKNLEFLKFSRVVEAGEFLSSYGKGKIKPGAVFHMGACSSTTETDREYIMRVNYHYTREIAQAAAASSSRFIYASSAATYGDGTLGFSDEHSRLKEYTPLNLYGESKHLFDIYALESGLLESIAGIKYFNVYGPNEYHKKSMRSFVVKAYEQIQNEGEIRLFKSYRDDIGDGEQRRDFLYIKDAADMTLHFFDNPGICGIFNAGTGIARTWNSLARSVFSAMGISARIKYVDMPEELRGQYQYYTCADTAKLLESGYRKETHSLEKGIEDYVRNYLPDRRLGCCDGC